MSFGKNWNKLGRKGHRHERSQLKERQHLGFLEHHKDYQLRAKNYHVKQNELQHLRLLASFRNKDEFHSDMVHNTEAIDGRLWINNKNNPITGDTKNISKKNKQLLKQYQDSDHRFLTMRLVHEQRKLKREVQQFHCLDAIATPTNTNTNNNNNSNQNQNNNKSGEKTANNLKNKNKNRNVQIIAQPNSFSAKKKKRKTKNGGNIGNTAGNAAATSDHIIFVANNKERLEFDACNHFETCKELLNQKHNRLRIGQLTQSQLLLNNKNNTIRNKKKKLLLSNENATQLKKEAMLNYWKMGSRMRRVSNMKKYMHKLNLNRKLLSGDDYLCYKKRNIRTGKVIKKRYKWKRQRKR